MYVYVLGIKDEYFISEVIMFSNYFHINFYVKHGNF